MVVFAYFNCIVCVKLTTPHDEYRYRDIYEYNQSS